jgi:hypothetical protein
MTRMIEKRIVDASSLIHIENLNTLSPACVGQLPCVCVGLNEQELENYL